MLAKGRDENVDPSWRNEWRTCDENVDESRRFIELVESLENASIDG